MLLLNWGRQCIRTISRRFWQVFRKAIFLHKRITKINCISSKMQIQRFVFMYGHVHKKKVLVKIIAPVNGFSRDKW